MDEMDYYEMSWIDPEEEPTCDFYEDWDNLEMGFDPYMGCYTDDC